MSNARDEYYEKHAELYLAGHGGLLEEVTNYVGELEQLIHEYELCDYPEVIRNNRELKKMNNMLEQQNKELSQNSGISKIIIIEVTPRDEGDPFKRYGMMVVFSTAEEFHDGMKFDYGLINQCIEKGYMIQILPKEGI